MAIPTCSVPITGWGHHGWWSKALSFFGNVGCFLRRTCPQVLQAKRNEFRFIQCPPWKRQEPCLSASRGRGRAGGGGTHPRGHSREAVPQDSPHNKELPRRGVSRVERPLHGQVLGAPPSGAGLGVQGRGWGPPGCPSHRSARPWILQPLHGVSVLIGRSGTQTP